MYPRDLCANRLWRPAPAILMAILLATVLPALTWAAPSARASITPAPNWTAVGAAANDLFGGAVSTAGDVNGDGYDDLVVGAPDADGRGKTYLFLGSTTGPGAIPARTASGETQYGRFGSAVAGVGDINQDGYADVVVSSPESYSRAGKIFLYLGTPSGLASTPAWTALGEANDNYFGSALAGAGDVNGDSYADVVVGAAVNNQGAGKAYLYLGGTSGLSTTPGWSATGAAGNRFGSSVASAGDVNKDGYGDVVVGAYGYDANLGAAYLYLGSATGLGLTPAWAATGAGIASQFGQSVAGAGDTNGDGYDDVLVSETGDSLSGFARAYLYHGSTTGLSVTATWGALGTVYDRTLGERVAGAGDLNGDGYDDIAITAYSVPSYLGHVFIHLGSPTGPGALPAWTIDSDRFESLQSAGPGDVNHDGYDDLVLGNSASNSRTGRVDAYYGFVPRLYLPKVHS